MNCKYYIAKLFIWRRESLFKKKEYQLILAIIMKWDSKKDCQVESILSIYKNYINVAI